MTYPADSFSLCSAAEKWHIYVVGVAFALICAPLNLREAVIGKSLYFGMCLSIATCFVFAIVLPVRSQGHTDAKFIFTDFQNFTGWSDGVAFILGLINANFCFCFLDAAVHFTEETANPRRDVPRIILATVIMGFLTAFPIACIILYCLTDYEAVATSGSGYPVFDLIDLALHNKAGAIIVMVLVLVCGATSLISVHAYQARVIWAFARDNGLPFSNLWKQLNPTARLPLNAHMAAIVLNVIVAVIAVGSSTAYAR